MKGEQLVDFFSLSWVVLFVTNTGGAVKCCVLISYEIRVSIMVRVWCS